MKHNSKVIGKVLFVFTNILHAFDLSQNLNIFLKKYSCKGKSFDIHIILSKKLI